MENTKYHSVGTIPTSKSVDYTVERDTNDTSNVYINDRSISLVQVYFNKKNFLLFPILLSIPMYWTFYFTLFLFIFTLLLTSKYIML